MKYIVGRTRTADIVPDVGRGFETISGRHLTVEPTGNGLYRLTDLGSSNGSFYEDGHGGWCRFVAVELTGPHKIRLGSYKTTVEALVSGRHPKGR